MPRTMNSMPFSSMTLPPTFKLLWRTVSMTICSVTFSARIRSDETSIWYCRTKPPTLATSATPGTALSW